MYKIPTSPGCQNPGVDKSPSADTQTFNSPITTQSTNDLLTDGPCLSSRPTPKILGPNALVLQTIVRSRFPFQNSHHDSLHQQSRRSFDRQATKTRILKTLMTKNALLQGPKLPHRSLTSTLLSPPDSSSSRNQHFLPTNHHELLRQPRSVHYDQRALKMLTRPR